MSLAVVSVRRAREYTSRCPGVVRGYRAYDRPVLDVTALRSAARAAIVIPLVFVLADKVVAKPQASILAAFGSFAVLVLVEFVGPPLTRLAAYAGLGCAGALLVTLGTLCSRNTWLAAGAMAVVGFVVIFSGALHGYFAAAATGAILTFVLPVTIPVPASAIPDRLEGWGLAVGIGTLAAMLLWPPRRSADDQRAAAGALRAVADVVDPGSDDLDERGLVARAAVDGLGRRLLGAQHRPAGPTAPTAALASLPDELDWLLSFLPAPSAAVEPARAEAQEAMAAATAVLRASAALLEGSRDPPDIARLEAARDALTQALVRHLPELHVSLSDDQLAAALDVPFRIRAVTYSSRQVAGYALRTVGADEPGSRPSFEAPQQLVVDHAGGGSVWFQNSARGAVGLAIAVYIAQRSGLQHSFWVVLGTLSVLRSNALGTGWSVLSALAGTAVGIVIGALLVIAIGTHEPILWAVFPVAILLAAYAPRAISFAAGQAGFTVVLFVLFNLIQPVGWKVGLVRVEDVAIGFAISLGVGLLFWPRGAGAVLRGDLAASYARGADHVVATAHRIIDGGKAASTSGTARAADAALHRLDDAFRQYLTERSATGFNVEDVAVFVGGAARVRRAAHSLSSLARIADDGPRLEPCGANLERELHALQSWYVALGYALVNHRPVPPPHIRDMAGRARLLACVREASAGGDEATLRSGLVLLWASQHVDNLWRLEGHLGERTRAMANQGADRGRHGRDRVPAASA
jgi:hypothetical protein